jgi:hypothetical protein
MRMKQDKKRYVQVEYRYSYYVPGVLYRHNWINTEGKALLEVRNARKEHILDRLKESGAKGQRDFQIIRIMELTRAQYLRLKARGKS